eukprot:1371848-Rhodomonas_salina.1
MDGSVVGLRWGMNEDSWGIVEDSWGNTAACRGKGVDNMQIPLQLHSKELKRRLAEISTATVSDSPSNGVLTSAQLDCFAPSVPELGQLPNNWWDCKSKEISGTSDQEIGEYLIEYWPADQREYYGEALDLDVVLDSTFPGQPVLKVLLSVQKGKPCVKKEKPQVAFLLAISKPRNGPDVSVRNAIR